MATATRSRNSGRSTLTGVREGAERKPLIGCEQPRVFTPPLRKLTPRTSLGFEAIEFATNVLGMTLMPWQQWLLIHMLELLPSGELRFRTVVILVARQNGKSTLSIVLSLYFTYVLARPLVIGTAQDLDVAEEIWQGAVDLALEQPQLAPLVEKVVRVNGQKTLKLITGERYKVKAANRRAGRGLSGDLILLDELREHQSWDAWGAISKTTMARAEALIVALSNAGDAASVVLRSLRLLAHLAVGNPDGLDEAGASLPDDDDEVDVDADSLGIFEWSAPPNCALGDRAGWAQANPALGHLITERAITSALRTDPEWVFRTEVLCQWHDGAINGPFPAGSWEAGIDPTSAIVDGGRFVFAVDVSHDRTSSTIVAAGRRADGSPHVEVVARRAGTEWVTPWLAERKGAPGLSGLAFQERGAPVSSLAKDLATTGIPLLPWSGAALGAACGSFYDLVCRVGGLWHRPQPVLDIAAATAAMKPLNDAWVWDRKKSPNDISPLVAATAAMWGLLQEPAAEPRIRIIGGQS